MPIPLEVNVIPLYFLMNRLPDSGIYAPSHRQACYRGRVILGV